MPHSHTWHLTCDLVLSLPDATGYRDRLIQYRCACGEHSSIHGGFHVDTRPFTLADLEAYATRELRSGPRVSLEKEGREYALLEHPGKTL